MLKQWVKKVTFYWVFQPQAIQAISSKQLVLRVKGMKVITLTGKDGGKMDGTADIEIRVPHFGYADRIQEIHAKLSIF